MVIIVLNGCFDYAVKQFKEYSEKYFKKHIHVLISP
jgi:hypothetical protein